MNSAACGLDPFDTLHCSLFTGVRLFFNNLEEVDLCAAFKECGVVAWIIGFKDCIEVL